METTIKHIVDQFFKDNQLDQIKQVEQKLTKQFGKNFIELARSVYINNEKRSKIKLEINKTLGSNIQEVKQYVGY